MAVLKIPQSKEQAKAGGNIRGVDNTLPLSLARQQGAAFGSVGKVFEDIYKEQRAIEDKKDFYEITKKVGTDIAQISSEVAKNSDLEFAHKTFDELTSRDKYDSFLEGKNRNVNKLFDNWLLKTKDAEYTSIAKKVIINSNNLAKGAINDKLDELKVKAASSDLAKAQQAEEEADSILKQGDTRKLFSDAEYKKLEKETKLGITKNRVIFGTKNNPQYTLNNIDEIAKLVSKEEVKEITDMALTAIAKKQSLIIQEEEEFEKKDRKAKSAIFSEIVFRIRDNKNPPDLDLLNDLVKGDQINSAQYDAILRFLENKNDFENDEILDLVAAQYYIAETVEELDQLRDMVTVDPEYLLSIGIKDVDMMVKVIDKSKDRTVHADIKFYQKKIDDITGKIDQGFTFKNFGPKEKADLGVRRAANRIYNQYIADGIGPEDAFMKTVNGYLLHQDKMPTIYDINQVTSIKIFDPTTQTQQKKGSDEIFDGWRSQVFAKYKNKQINIDELKRDIDVLDVMEDVFLLREKVKPGFGFQSSNNLNAKEELRPTAGK